MLTTPERVRLSRVLLVEDDESQLHTLTDILEDEGFEVVGCSNAQDSLRQMEESAFGVAVVDLRLPDLNGTQLLEEFKVLEPEIRVIIHTAYGSFDSAKAAVNLGAYGYIEKLSDPSELVRHIHGAFRGQYDQYADKLESRVQERTAELIDANRQLRDEIQERRRADEALRQMHEELELNIRELKQEVAERLRAEEELRQARDGLELRVQERTADLTESNKQLQHEIQIRQQTEETLRKEERLLHHLIDLHEGERKL
ncbi:MAG: response regulator, partial [Planctomycetales bacterium]